jgi:hypothetical protein
MIVNHELARMRKKTFVSCFKGRVWDTDNMAAATLHRGMWGSEGLHYVRLNSTRWFLERHRWSACPLPFICQQVVPSAAALQQVLCSTRPLRATNITVAVSLFSLHLSTLQRWHCNVAHVAPTTMSRAVRVTTSGLRGAPPPRPQRSIVAETCQATAAGHLRGGGGWGPHGVEAVAVGLLGCNAACTCWYVGTGVSEVLQPRRWKQYVPPKRSCLPKSPQSTPHGVHRRTRRAFWHSRTTDKPSQYTMISFVALRPFNSGTGVCVCVCVR